MKQLLLIEDDDELCHQLKTTLENNGFFCHMIEDYTDVDKQILSKINNGIHMILLDLSLPGKSGEYLLRELRSYSTIPVIILTSKNTEMDELLCMSLGADDFISKPYNPAILLLHIEAVLKRTNSTAEEEITYKNLHLNLANARLTLSTADGIVQTIELSKNEMRLLHYLMQHHGKIVSRDELICFLWDSDEFVDDNTLTVNMNRVRTKLTEIGTDGMIKTKRGIGYLFE